MMVVVIAAKLIECCTPVWLSRALTKQTKTSLLCLDLMFACSNVISLSIDNRQVPSRRLYLLWEADSTAATPPLPTRSSPQSRTSSSLQTSVISVPNLTGQPLLRRTVNLRSVFTSMQLVYAIEWLKFEDLGLSCRSKGTATPELQSVKETQVEANYVSKVATTLEGLILEDPYKESTSSETRNPESDESGDENGGATVSSGKNTSQVDTHTDVAEADGMIIIPYRLERSRAQAPPTKSEFPLVELMILAQARSCCRSIYLDPSL
ncbi:hypothetical protein Sango_1033100 [Sesamum angolense]|uniref:Uncharacterized protein n=1 Tax=Sesamum angolense TaxID=2727404 RepID=A0AAE1X072_9LAMI|nr:hypothetical protein Sango_1033100 [Sesamum angolense]